MTEIPISTSAKPYPPITVPIVCQGQPAVAIVDQIRSVAKHRLKSRIETIPQDQLDDICQALSQILELR
ncbi:MAG: type II toxin-antitoxin system PemK/MazF family toxin [Pseudomonadota bacterium]